MREDALKPDTVSFEICQQYENCEQHLVDDLSKEWKTLYEDENIKKPEEEVLETLYVNSP